MHEFGVVLNQETRTLSIFNHAQVVSYPNTKKGGKEGGYIKLRDRVLGYLIEREAESKPLLFSVIIFNQDIQVSQTMMRRIVRNCAPVVFRPGVRFTFCEGPRKDSWVSKYKRKFTSQFELQILMNKYIGALKKDQDWQSERVRLLAGGKEAQSPKEESGSKRPNDFWFGDFNEKMNNDMSGDQKQFASKINMFVFAVFLAYFIANSVDEDALAREGAPGGRKIVSEDEMISMLSTGEFNPEVIIIRESVFRDKNKRVYQTVCQVKRANKTEAPITCVVINLQSFLDRLEKIAFPYNVNFHYNAEEKPLVKLDIGKIFVYSFLVYIAYLIRQAYRKGGAGGGMGKPLEDLFSSKKFEPIKPENIKTLFKDVAGMHEAKKQITEFVDFLKSPDKYIEMGAKIPKGALLTGPPGTGKTLLARACSGEAGVPFFYVSGSEFVEKYVGLGANRVRNLFKSAAEQAPSIIFIDEIDAIGKKRNSGPFSNEEKENTLNQLLVNMDGFDSKNKIIVMAATNLKESLDPALLRPGRFDRSIEIGLPNFEERIEILKVHLAKIKYSDQFTVNELAKKVSILTTGFSGADLANICNEAAILAARAGKDAIQLPEFEKATERVLAGLEKRNLFTEEEKECLAYYECGKAVASWFTEGADPIIKISITPYSKQGKGYAHEIKDEMPLKTKSELLNKAMCYLAGRTAEKHFKGYITSNGDVDLKRAKRIITVMVSKFGMSPVIGRIGFPDIEYMRKPYSSRTEKQIDKQIDRIFKECQKRAEEIIVEKREQIEMLKKEIIVKETLTHNTLKEILGERPFQDNENYSRFLKESEQKEAEEEVTMTPPTPQYSNK